jgi:hypothetical protein
VNGTYKIPKHDAKAIIARSKCVTNNLDSCTFLSPEQFTTWLRKKYLVKVNPNIAQECKNVGFCRCQTRTSRPCHAIDIDSPGEIGCRGL